MEIKISKPTQKEVEKLRIESWSFWDCEPSRFDWQYSADETAYVLEGHVIVTPENGEPVEIKAGDLVTFPKGMKCVWDVKETIKKRFVFD